MIYSEYMYVRNSCVTHVNPENILQILADPIDYMHIFPVRESRCT